MIRFLINKSSMESNGIRWYYIISSLVQIIKPYLYNIIIGKYIISIIVRMPSQIKMKLSMVDLVCIWLSYFLSSKFQLGFSSFASELWAAHELITNSLSIWQPYCCPYEYGCIRLSKRRRKLRQWVFCEISLLASFPNKSSILPISKLQKRERLNTRLNKG